MGFGVPQMVDLSRGTVPSMGAPVPLAQPFLPPNGPLYEMGLVYAPPGTTHQVLDRV